jgi:hypothetical protein
MKFFEYLRISIHTFDYILRKVRDSFEKQTNKQTNWWRPIGAEERLVVAIRQCK